MPRHIRARTSLVFLAALVVAVRLFLGTPAVPATGASGPALLFFSSNTEDGLSLRQAVDRIKTPGHERARVLAGKVLRDLSAGPALVHDAIGDWEEGVENSLLVELTRCPDPDKLLLAAAWFGLIGDQKAVLAFRPEQAGPDLLVTLVVPGGLHEVRAALSRHGLRDRTILVVAEGCRVLILDEGGARREALAAAAAEMRATIETVPGKSEVLAGPTRDEARRRYHAVLREARLTSTRSK